MATIRRYDPSSKGQMIRTLRREIMAARLKVALDKELKRETSATVISLAGMILPPAITPRRYVDIEGANSGANRQFSGPAGKKSPDLQQKYAAH